VGADLPRRACDRDRPDVTRKRKTTLVRPSSTARPYAMSPPRPCIVEVKMLRLSATRGLWRFGHRLW
jgi:hypothetical protein